MIRRNITSGIIDACKDTPVIFLRGARQVGKTTLARDILKDKFKADYFTLDNAGTLAAAYEDPIGFISAIEGPVIIDEAQKAPQLLPAIKESVDINRRPGRFILTGSSNILTSIKVSESLAGRMEIFDLYPFSQGEIGGISERFIDHVFDEKQLRVKYATDSYEDILKKIVLGGYPEAVSRPSDKRRQAWFDAYLTSILERDVRYVANIQDFPAMFRLHKLLASRTASLLSYSDLSRSMGIPQTTLKRYIATAVSIFSVFELPAWASNIGKRLIKSPKIMFVDTGLAASLIGCDISRLAGDTKLAGNLLENFVTSEIRKQSAWNNTSVGLFHYRDVSGKEVDLVLENKPGKIVGIEVKSASTLSASDFSGLKALRENTKDRFVRGIVLYAGNDKVPFGDDLYALPISAMWEK